MEAELEGLDVVYEDVTCPGCGSARQIPLLRDGAPGSKLVRKLSRIMKCDRCISQLEAAQREDSLRDAAALHVKRLNESGLPPGLWGLEWNTMIPNRGRAEVIDAAKRWAQEGGTLFLFGRPGPGKTRLAATAFYALLKIEPGAWVNVPTLFTKAGASYSSDWRREAERVLFGKHALVLDDLGKESTSDHNRQLLQTAIEDRLANGTRLLITSNMQANELGAKWGDWLASRLGAMPQYELPGPDLRIVE
jgi:DNA replication protein DnaC